MSQSQGTHLHSPMATHDGCIDLFFIIKKVPGCIQVQEQVFNFSDILVSLESFLSHSRKYNRVTKMLCIPSKVFLCALFTASWTEIFNILFKYLCLTHAPCTLTSSAGMLYTHACIC